MSTKLLKTKKAKLYHHSGKPCSECGMFEGLHRGYCSKDKSSKAPTQERLHTPAVLCELADLFEVRNSTYKDNFRIVGAVMAAMQPDGASLKTKEDHELYHLYSLIIVKLTRFVASDFTHEDSIKDIGVYSAMITAILQERAKK